MTKLRQRMQEELWLRNYSPQPIRAYTAMIVDKIAVLRARQHKHRSLRHPDRAAACARAVAELAVVGAVLREQDTGQDRTLIAALKPRSVRLDAGRLQQFPLITVQRCRS